MLKALGHKSPFQSNNSPEVEKVEENSKKNEQLKAFDYTFDANKAIQNQNLNRDSINELNSGNNDNQKVLNFDDPYLYNNTPANKNKENEEQGVQTILVQLDNYLKRNKNMNSSKSLPYSERQNEIDQPQNHHNYSASVRDPQIDSNHEIWQKSYHLLERLNSERYTQVRKIKPDKFSFNDNLKDALSEASNYKIDERHFARSSQRNSALDLACKANTEPQPAPAPIRTRNSTVHSVTEVKTDSSRPDFILYNKKMINEMLKMLNPSKTIYDRL